MNKLLLTSRKNEMNQPATYSDNWYGSGRPVQIWRKVLDPTCHAYGPQMKMLQSGCNSCLGPMGPNGMRIHGNVISFNGGSGITSASSKLSPTYYANTSSYLRSRGQAYTSNINIHKKEGISYADENGIVWPEVEQAVGNSSIYASNVPADKCPDNVSIYKPNNSTFSTQGAVTSSARLLKLKVNALNAPQLTTYEKRRQKLTLPPQPFWGILG